MSEGAKPLFSIIVPIYNAERYLRRCLGSLSQQQFGDFEVLMINDGSTDGSEELCRHYAAEDVRFRLINQENQGVSAARNAGLDYAKGTYLLFLDSDDYVDPSFTAEFRRLMSSGADLGISGYYECYEETGEQVAKDYGAGRKSVKEYLFLMSTNPIDNYFGVLWNKCFRRDVMDVNHIRFELGRSYGEDYGLLVDYLNCIESVCLSAERLYYYLFDRAASLGKGIGNVARRSEEVAYVYRKYCESWRCRGLYRRNRKRIQFYGAKLYFEEGKKFSQEDCKLLKQKIMLDNDFSCADVAIFELLREIKHLLKK